MALLAAQAMAGTKGRGEPENGGRLGSEPPQSETLAPSSGCGSSTSGERATTPAPTSVSGEWASSTSDRPTSVPTYDVAAVAFETTMRHPSGTSLPLDVAVPVRTSPIVPTGLDLRASFLLLHVDGASSLRDIADATGLALADVQSGFLALTAEGLVELGGTTAVRAVPRSGARTQHDGDPSD